MRDKDEAKEPFVRFRQCGTCSGRGTVAFGPDDVTCAGCEGTGRVVIDGAEEPDPGDLRGAR